MGGVAGREDSLSRGVILGVHDKGRQDMRLMTRDMLLTQVAMGVAGEMERAGGNRAAVTRPDEQAG